jgi:hypothetical protein
MYNPIIVIAIIVQAVISRISLIAGAICGYLVTTGILIWGMTVYGEGDQIAFIGIGLSQPIFIVACLIWYGVDTYEMSKVLQALKEQKAYKAMLAEALNSPVMKDDAVRQFYKSTQDVWVSGKLNFLNKEYKKEAKKQKPWTSSSRDGRPFPVRPCKSFCKTINLFPVSSWSRRENCLK